MSGLPRTIVKWLQGLDLTFPIKNPKWDLSNGFLIAEIFSWYYPDDINMLTFNTGQSLDSKMSNWSLIKKFVYKNNIDLPVDLVDSTMHCKDGAAILLIEKVFQLLTNRQVQKSPLEYEIDLTDWAYQKKLPFHARSTASKSIKNNIKGSEVHTDPNLKLNSQKAETLISFHVEHRKMERDDNPKRFSVKKTIGEKCVQRPMPEARKSSEYSFDNEQKELERDQKPSNERNLTAILFDEPVNPAHNYRQPSGEKNYKEIRVKQELFDQTVN